MKINKELEKILLIILGIIIGISFGYGIFITIKYIFQL